MSEEIIEEKKEEKVNPFLTPVKIIEPEHKLPDYTFDMLPDEQKAILQSLVDEAYDQFTGIVAEGRKMDIKTVKKLADGRIYSAKQAKENGLIDEIGTFQECKDAIKADYSLGADIQFLDFLPAETSELFNYLGISSEEFRDMMESMKDSGVLTASQIKELEELNGSFEIMYMVH